MSDLLPVADALASMTGDVEPIAEVEEVDLHEAASRILTRDLVARRTQPPFPASAMDGYAVRAADLPGSLRVIGEAAAGRGFDGRVGAGECVRIFTGAPVPDGSDTIAIQENAEVLPGGTVRFAEGEDRGRFVRPVGLDFEHGVVLLQRDRMLDAGAVSLAAAMGYPTLPVRRRPRVALIANGNELVRPGEPTGPHAIVASNTYGVAAIVRAAGAVPLDLGIVPDDRRAIADALRRADEADIVVTLGGASVGDHDLVGEALRRHGVAMRFLKLAMKPGKPVMFGARTADGRTVRYLGLPGNPVSSLVGARVLLRPVLRAMLGQPFAERPVTATLAAPLPPSGDRQTYLRAVLDESNAVRAHETQDSSQLSVLAASNALLVRPAHRPAAKTGDFVEVLPWT